MAFKRRLKEINNMKRDFKKELKTFIEAIALVKMNRADVIETSMDAFENDFELFYFAMDLAAREGVAVLLHPIPIKRVDYDDNRVTDSN